MNAKVCKSRTSFIRSWGFLTTYTFLVRWAGIPTAVWFERIAPQLAQYLGEHISEWGCHQWLQKYGHASLGLSLESAGRWWSRDGQTEVDTHALSTGGGYLLSECKWSAGHAIGPKVYFDFLAKESRLPDSRWRAKLRYILFSLEGFSPEPEALAASPENRLHLVGPELLLPG